MSKQEPWVSVGDVSNHFGILRGTVYRWIESNSLPAQRVEHLSKFKISQVAAWIEAGGASETENEEFVR